MASVLVFRRSRLPWTLFWATKIILFFVFYNFIGLFINKKPNQNVEKNMGNLVLILFV